MNFGGGTDLHYRSWFTSECCFPTYGYLIFDLKVPSIPLQSSKAPVLCAANKSDARVHAAGFLRGPARAARPCCAVVPPLKQGARAGLVVSLSLFMLMQWVSENLRIVRHLLV